LSTTTQSAQPHLIRALGRRDLVLLFVVAVFNLNVVPSIAANGGVTIWLWIISLLLFFWPQGIAVIELAHRYPGEGGVYLWAKEVFGDFHGFLSGWCYWTNNMLYVPTVMLYFVGVSVFILGPSHAGLADNRTFALVTSLTLLALLTLLNIVGLGIGKWINNLGAIGTFIAAAVLIGLGAVIWSRFGTTITAADFQVPANPRFVLNSFGVICFGLVGLELASVMGDEIQDPSRTLPGAVAWGGVLSAALYIGATLTLLIAVGKNVNVLQGIVQAVSHMAGSVGVAWITVPFAIMLSISIAGIGSAWMGGCSRIPFVAGLDSYMPSWMGNIHRRYATPYVALIVQAIVLRFSSSSIFLAARVFRKLSRSCFRSRSCCNSSHSCICSGRSSDFPSRSLRLAVGTAALLCCLQAQAACSRLFSASLSYSPQPSRSRRCGRTNCGCLAARCFSSAWPRSFSSSMAATRRRRTLGRARPQSCR